MDMVVRRELYCCACTIACCMLTLLTGRFKVRECKGRTCGVIDSPSSSRVKASLALLNEVLRKVLNSGVITLSTSFPDRNPFIIPVFIPSFFLFSSLPE